MLRLSALHAFNKHPVTCLTTQHSCLGVSVWQHGCSPSTPVKYSDAQGNWLLTCSRVSKLRPCLQLLVVIVVGTG